MLQEVDPSRTSTRGSLPGEIFIYWGEGKAGREGRRGGQEPDAGRNPDSSGVGTARAPQARGLAADRFGLSLAVLRPPSANAFARCLRSPGRPPSFLLGLARPPARPAQRACCFPPEPGDEEAG